MSHTGPQKANNPPIGRTEDADGSETREIGHRAAVERFPDGNTKNNAIGKLYRFKEFMDGIRFLNKVAEMAEAADHHPDVKIDYIRITFSCSTHDQGGVSEKDFELASKIEEAFKATRDNLHSRTIVPCGTILAPLALAPNEVVRARDGAVDFA